MVATAVAIRHLRGSTASYGLSVALSFLKLHAGALTAVLGLLLLHGRFVPGLSDLDTPGRFESYLDMRLCTISNNSGIRSLGVTPVICWTPVGVER
jgi:hypothetical protein